MPGERSLPTGEVWQLADAIEPRYRYQHATVERDQVIAQRMEDLISGSRFMDVSRRLRSIPS